MKTNIPYSYLQDIAARRNNGSWLIWIIFRFALSPGVLLGYFDYSTRARTEQPAVAPAKAGWSHLWQDVVFLFQRYGTTLLYVVSYAAYAYIKARASDATPAREIWLEIAIKWLSVSVTANILTLVLIYLFAFPADSARLQLKEDLSDELGDKLLGHKLWAQKMTYGLFSQLIGIRAKGRRARWFVVNFLAHLVDERIKCCPAKGGVLYTISTGGNPWSACIYSQFLAKNMDHAEDEILWLVDPNDLFGTILPEFVRYVLAASAVQQWKAPGWSFRDFRTRSVDGAYKAYLTNPPSGVTTDDWADYCETVLPSESREVVPKLDSEDESCDSMSSVFHTHILPPLVRFGWYLANKAGDRFDSESIDEGFRVLSKHYLDYVFPHFEAFGKAMAPVKKRVLFLGYNLPEEAEAAWIDDQIRVYWAEQKKQGKWDDIKQVANESVVRKALELFAKTSGGDPERIVVQGYGGADPNLKETLDIGFYDQRFVVSSRPVANDSSKRFVDWLYWAPTDPTDDSKKSYEALSSKDRGTAIALEVLSSALDGSLIKFDAFKEKVVKHVSDVLTDKGQ